jgi:hypothetical protein
MQFYRRNYIEGLFLSSGVRHNPTETMEQIYIALRLLREQNHFNGYIHVKAIPGAAPEIVAAVGLLADRMSTNLELPTAEGLRTLAPNKTRETILKPMRQIQQGIAQSKRGEHLRISGLTQNDSQITTKWGFAIPDPTHTAVTALTDAAGYSLRNGQNALSSMTSDNSSTSLVATDSRNVASLSPDNSDTVPLPIAGDHIAGNKRTLPPYQTERNINFLYRQGRAHR